MRSVFSDTSQSHASFITHPLCLCSFLTFPCINSICSLLTNCVCSHIYCSLSPRRPQSLSHRSSCVFSIPRELFLFPEWVHKTQVLQKDFKEAGDPEGIPIYQCVLLWHAIDISGPQRVMWAEGTKVPLSDLESLFVILLQRFCVVTMNQTVSSQELKSHLRFWSSESVKVFYKLRLLAFLLNDKCIQWIALTEGSSGAMAGKGIFT